MYYSCPKCGNLIGTATTISFHTGENPNRVGCNKCGASLSIQLPYTPPLRSHLKLRIFLCIVSVIGLISGYFLMSHVWNSINNTILSFLGAAGVAILTLVIFLVSILIVFHKEENRYAHGYNLAFGDMKRAELEGEMVFGLIALCVINAVLIVVSCFAAIRHLF